MATTVYTVRAVRVALNVFTTWPDVVWTARLYDPAGTGV
jgi:hypothetical protein